MSHQNSNAKIQKTIIIFWTWLEIKHLAVLRRTLVLHMAALLINTRFSFPAFKIFKYKCTQLIKRGKESLAIICFGKFRHKALQVRVAGNHKRSDGYLKFFALCSKIEAAIGYFSVEAKTVLVIPVAYLEAGWLAIGNHKNLLVRVFPSSQNVHREFKSGNRIGMVWAYL